MALTLAQIRSKVKARYERNTSSNDVRNSLVDGFINDSLREIYNTIGDEAYFLRKTQSVTINATPTVTTLPADVRRLYRIEDETVRPGTQIPWNFLRHDSSGNMVILCPTSGTFTVHYLDVPDDLALDADATPLPPEHGELVVVMTCRRLADALGNAQFSQAMYADIVVLAKALKRDCMRYNRQRREAFQTTWNTGSSNPWQYGWTGG